MTVTSIIFRIADVRMAAALQGFATSFRGMGAVVGSAIGGSLYGMSGGGYPMPFVVPALGFLLVHAILFCVSTYADAMPPVDSAASVLSVLRVWQAWPALIATPFLSLFGSYALEPLYAPLLLNKPYHLSFRHIGQVVSAIAAAQVTVTFVGAALLNCINAAAQQALGASCITLGFLLLGPSPLFGFGSNMHTTPLASGSLLLIGCGVGLVMPTHSLFMMRILQREAGLHKRQIGGAVATTTISTAMVGVRRAPYFAAGGVLRSRRAVVTHTDHHRVLSARRVLPARLLPPHLRALAVRASARTLHACPGAHRTDDEQRTLAQR
jgi:hypothetical protein